MPDEPRGFRERFAKRIADTILPPLPPHQDGVGAGTARHRDTSNPAPTEHQDAAPVEVRSQLDTILNPLTGLGSTTLDKGSAARPDTSRRKLTDDELFVLYRFDGLMRRIIDIIPDDATRAGWETRPQTDDPTEKRVNLTADEDKRLDTVSTVNRAWKLGRALGGGFVLIVTREKAPANIQQQARGERGALEAAILKTELKPENVIAVDNLVVLDKTECTVDTYDGDIRSPNYRRPKFYNVSPVTSGIEDYSTLNYARIHHSRLLYFPGAWLPPSRLPENGGVDDSILQALWDSGRDMNQIARAMAALAQELKIDVLKIKDYGKKSSGDQATLLRTKMQILAMAKGILNLVLLGDGDEYITKPANVSGAKDLFQGAQSMLSAVTGMSTTLLFGQAPSGLSTDDKSGRMSWEHVIQAIQQAILYQQLIRLYTIVLAADEGPTNGQLPESWDVFFSPLQEPTDAELAETILKTTQSDKENILLGVYGPDDVARSRYGENGFRVEMLPVTPSEDVPEIEDEPELGPDAVPPDEQINSGGHGRGQMTGEGKGPIGEPAGD